MMIIEMAWRDSLITNQDFGDMQMILTCHGELFVSKPENYVSGKRNDQILAFATRFIGGTGNFYKVSRLINTS